MSGRGSPASDRLLLRRAEDRNLADSGAPAPAVLEIGKLYFDLILGTLSADVTGDGSSDVLLILQSFGPLGSLSASDVLL
jgi:hypothetical protein